MAVLERQEGTCLHCRVSPPPLTSGWLLTTPTGHTHHSNAKQMPADVLEALAEVCGSHGGLEQADAEQLLRQLQQSRHLQMETWA